MLLHEDDVQRRQEGVLVDAHLAGHEVVDLLRLQQRRVWSDVQLSGRKCRVGISLI